MALGYDGCTDNEDLKDWYLFILKNQHIKDELIQCSTKEVFADRIFELAKENGYFFTRSQLEETFSPFGGLDVSYEEDKWVQKLLKMGWSPLGYSR